MKHSETEKDYLDKESGLLKEISVAEFELNGLIQVAGNYCLWLPFSVLKYFCTLYLFSLLVYFPWPCKSHYYSLQRNEYELIYFVILIHFSYLYSPHLTSASHYLSAVYPVMIKISSHSCHHVQVPMYKRNSKLMTSTFR